MDRSPSLLINKEYDKHYSSERLVTCYSLLFFEKLRNFKFPAQKSPTRSHSSQMTWSSETKMLTSEPGCGEKVIILIQCSLFIARVLGSMTFQPYNRNSLITRLDWVCKQTHECTPRKQPYSPLNMCHAKQWHLQVQVQVQMTPADRRWVWSWLE